MFNRIKVEIKEEAQIKAQKEAHASRPENSKRYRYSCQGYLCHKRTAAKRSAASRSNKWRESKFTAGKIVPSACIFIESYIDAACNSTNLSLLHILLLLLCSSSNLSNQSNIT
jgi:hypothetical protein